uniref:Uncharacterized protein n=1 Tax=Meloidogyne incognita TaxID=6306 RepID=A0A914MUS7_MELIC
MILNYYYDILNAQQQRVGVLILKSTKDLFVVWHLFGIARSLIHSFLKDYSRKKNDYDRKLSQRQMLISVFSYIKAFDELEVMANFLMRWFRTLNVLQGGAIQFSHIGLIYNRPNMLMSLQEAENHVNAIYPVQSEDVGNNDNIEFNFLINISDLYFPKLTNEECQNINFLIQTQANIQFYNLYNQVNEIVKRKIDILIGRNLKELFIGNKEYLPENSESLPNRFNFVTKIRDECLAIMSDHAESSARGIDLVLKL